MVQNSHFSKGEQEVNSNLLVNTLLKLALPSERVNHPNDQTSYAIQHKMLLTSSPML